MVLHIVLVEDEPVALEQTQKTIKQAAKELQMLTVFRTFADGAEIKDEDILWSDLFFLDIETKGENGIDTARRIRETTERTPIVFTTNHESYSVEGYTVQAYRYLLKPVEEGKCIDCLEHAASLAETKSQELFILNQKGNQTLIYYRDVVYIEAAGHYCNIYTKKGMIKYRKRFAEFVKEVPPDQFIQCHRSYLVNRNSICSHGLQGLLMSNGKKVPVSRSCTDNIKAALIDMWGR